jgi:hypothetical protein
MVSSFDAVEVRRLRQQSPYDPSIGRVGNSFVLTCRPELNWHVDIEWIDFRVALDGTGRTVHFHLESRGRYFTGAFAYMVIRRVVGHGLRLVGTLKDGPDVNVWRSTKSEVAAATSEDSTRSGVPCLDIGSVRGLFELTL